MNRPVLRAFAIISVLSAVGTAEVPKDITRPVSEIIKTRDRGPHSKTVDRISSVQDEEGTWFYRTNSYVHIEQGLNYKSENGEWVEAEEAFILTPEGAIAEKGQHRVQLPANLNIDLAVKLVQADGKRLTSRPWALVYYDEATGESALLAELQDCQGYQVSQNQIIYPNAFDSLKADVRYTYLKSSFEQDIILRQAPPAPEKFGLNPATTRLEVWTEFTGSPPPTRSKSALNRDDETLDFGAMKMGTGRAFQLGTDTGRSVPVRKKWTEIQDRSFLIEAIDVPDASESLHTLPSAPDGAALSPKFKSREVVLNQLGSKGKGGSKESAFISPAPSSLIQALAGPALVMDYNTQSGPTLTGSYVFKGDTTYLLNGSISTTTTAGTTTRFEGGTVIKYAPGANLTVQTAVDWQGSLYRPIILTARDDHSVGEKIGTATLSGSYATTALNLTTVTPSHQLKHLRIAHAQTAIAFAGGSGHVVAHAQLVNCGIGISAATAASYAVQNALFAGLTTGFAGGATIQAEHLTASGVGILLQSSTASLTLKNSLLANVTTTPLNIGTTTALVAGTGTFQSSQAGFHYLADGSPFRNVGTTTITPTLLDELKLLTTYPPNELMGTISVQTSLTPSVPRDTDLPDLGYHYPTLDYVAKDLIINNTTLKLQNGVAVAGYGSKLLTLSGTAQLLSAGLAQKLNRLTTLQTVQEQSLPLVTTTSSFTLINGANADFDFTDVSFMAGPARKLIPGGYTYLTGSIENCSLRGWSWDTYTTVPPYPVVTFKNNLFERCTFVFGAYSGPSYYGVDLLWNNNLFRNSSISVSYNPTILLTWGLFDNVFDTVALTVNQPTAGNINASHNAYFATSQLPYSSGPQISIVGPLNWQSGPLGNYYYPVPAGGTSLSGLINADSTVSRTPVLLKLHNYTTRIDREKDGATASQLDIGFHYVATDAGGMPLDSDSDGIPDYLEDSGGTAWNNADTDGDGVTDFTELQTGTNPTSVNASLIILTPP